MGDVALIILLWSVGLPGIVNGVHGFDDLLISPRARNLLATRARRLYQPMTSARIRELARLKPDGGPAAVSAPETVERMAEFEQQFGGLWYSILRDRENGMEYGLEGDCTVFRTGFGPAFRGIMDGAWTWPVDILHDGRTLMRLGGHVSDRVIDSSTIQRIEGHALLSVAGHWPHHRYRLAVPAGTEPTVNAGAFPPVAPEATGPTSRWWFDGDRAALLRLERWWVRRSGAGMTTAALDHWTMWCFARAQSDLAWASARRGDISGDPVTGQDWCVMCLRSTPEDVSCRPSANST
jgi:hypothetical protein